MSLQAFLARLYVDARFRGEFFDNPSLVTEKAGLPAEEARALQAMDRAEVELAAASFKSKRDRTCDFGTTSVNAHLAGGSCSDPQ